MPCQDTLLDHKTVHTGTKRWCCGTCGKEHRLRSVTVFCNVVNGDILIMATCINSNIPVSGYWSDVIGIRLSHCRNMITLRDRRTVIARDYILEVACIFARRLTRAMTAGNTCAPSAVRGSSPNRSSQCTSGDNNA